VKPFAVALPHPRRPLLAAVAPPIPLPRPAVDHVPRGRVRNQDLTITVEWCGRTLVAAADGDIDLTTAPMLHDALEAARSRAPRRIVVDLSRVRFLNSAGLAVLIDAHRRAGPGAGLRLVATTRATWRPLRIARDHERLLIHSSLAEALAAPTRPEDGAR
jgi:anti-sigma B factor antagonist